LKSVNAAKPRRILYTRWHALHLARAVLEKCRLIIKARQLGLPGLKNAKLFGIVIEVSLNVDDGRALIAAAGGQIRQRADQIGQTARGGALRDHRALEALRFFIL
jgi:hypothetical protein